MTSREIKLQSVLSIKGITFASSLWGSLFSWKKLVFSAAHGIMWVVHGVVLTEQLEAFQDEGFPWWSG